MLNCRDAVVMCCCNADDNTTPVHSYTWHAAVVQGTCAQCLHPDKPERAAANELELPSLAGEA